MVRKSSAVSLRSQKLRGGVETGQGKRKRVVLLLDFSASHYLTDKLNFYFNLK